MFFNSPIPNIEDWRNCVSKTSRTFGRPGGPGLNAAFASHILSPGWKKTAKSNLIGDARCQEAMRHIEVPLRYDESRVKRRNRRSNTYNSYPQPLPYNVLQAQRAVPPRQYSPRQYSPSQNTYGLQRPLTLSPSVLAAQRAVPQRARQPVSNRPTSPGGYSQRNSPNSQTQTVCFNIPRQSPQQFQRQSPQQFQRQSPQQFPRQSPQQFPKQVEQNPDYISLDDIERILGEYTC